MKGRIIMGKYNKIEKSWILYDCTISTYSMIVISTILPIFFRMVFENAGGNSSMCTVYWGYINSISRLLIAVAAPIIGTMADYKGYKMKFFKIFCVIGIIFTALLGIVPDSAWVLLMVIFVISSIGNSGSNIFYDAFLVDVTPKSKMHMVSSIGYAAGYLGDILAFAICMSIVILAGMHRLPISVGAACKISFIITAVWCTLFSVPIIKNVKQVYGIEKEPNIVKNSFKRLASTVKNISNHKNIVMFLLAYFFYIDGVNTIITMATSFGADLGMSSSAMLIDLLLTMVVAFPCSIIFGKLSEKFKGKTMLYVGIIIYSVICVYANFIHNMVGFLILSILVGTSQGGMQAISRSYFGKIIPKHRNNEFFGFFNIFGRFAAILGPSMIAVASQITGKSSMGIFSLLILFVFGGLFLTRVSSVEDESVEADLEKDVVV
jgi:UMF1 family MFS transporter